MKTRITRRTVDALPPGGQIADREVRGFRARRLPSGIVTFSFRYSGASGRNEIPLGLHGTVTAEQARDLAKRYAGKVAAKADPAAELRTSMARSQNTVNFIVDEWLARYAYKRLRSAKPVAAIFANHVRPAIGEEVIYDLTRTQVAKMLNGITDRIGGVMANRTRALLHSVFEWWRDQDEKFITMPVPRGIPVAEKARDRALAPDEIRDLWQALDEMAKELDTAYPLFVRVLLLTACRRDEVADMHTREFEKDGSAWRIPADRYKTKIDHVMPLVPVLKAMLPTRQNGYVFSNNGGAKPINGFAKGKIRLDRKIAEIRKRDGRGPMAPWQLRDLRRTASTHMAAAGIADNISERVLGHVIGGMHGRYNVWDYRNEKADALTRWAAYVDRVVHSSPDNIVPLRGR